MINIAALLIVSTWAATAPQAELKLEIAGRTQSITLKELRAKLKPSEFTVNDLNYKKSKTYEGFWLKDVLRLGGVSGAEGDELVFHCADGYAPTVSVARAAEKKGFIAFAEKGAKDGWEKVQQGKAWLSPAPYYLVWDTQEEAFPWPYQLVKIEVVRFQQKYDRIFPAGLAKSDEIYRGFEHFRVSCLRCHSLNLQGGEIGPELNVPKNITEYRDEAFIRAFVRDASSFRARSKMPPFPDLKDDEMSQILAYLRWMKSRKSVN